MFSKGYSGIIKAKNVKHKHLLTVKQTHTHPSSTDTRVERSIARHGDMLNYLGDV